MPGGTPLPVSGLFLSNIGERHTRRLSVLAALPVKTCSTLMPHQANKVRAVMKVLSTIIACAVLSSLSVRADDPIAVVARPRRNGIPVYQNADAKSALKGVSANRSEVLILGDYVPPFFDATPKGSESGYFVKATDVVFLAYRPARVRRRTAGYDNMSMRRKKIIELAAGTAIKVLDSIPEQHACLAYRGGSYFWVDCGDLDASLRRNGCYALGQQLDIVRHTVQKNETLTSLSTEYGLSPSELAKACGTNNSAVLRLGAACRLQLPGNALIHRVQRGETLESIGSLFELQSTTAFRRLNCLPDRDIKAGQRLLVVQ
jgi:hypothetical protein